VALLRSPWFFVPDARIEKWMTAIKKGDSLWAWLDHQEDPIVTCLKEGARLAREKGVTFAFESLLRSVHMLDLALHHDPAGRKESNLWKIIMKARALEKEGARSLLDLRGEDLVF